VSSRLLVTANVLSSQSLVNLMMEAMPSTETSVLTGAARRNIPEDGVIHSLLRENFNSYVRNCSHQRVNIVETHS
jgi:hypothetical protein